MLKKKRRVKTVQIKKITDRDIVKITKSKTEIFKKEIAQYLDNNGFLSWSSKERKYLILGTNSPKKGLVKCPECKVGELF
jgi:putative DNA topoisomerase